MRASRLLPILTLLASPLAWAEKAAFEDDRFSLEFPADWKKAAGPDDGHVLHREAPGGEGTFSVFTLKIKKDHRADLEATLKNRVEAVAKAGLKVTGDVEGQEGAVDGKRAVFAVIPVETAFDDQKVTFRYSLVLVDALDTVVVMQVALPSPAPPGLQKAALAIIQSFQEMADK